jgi:GNAT superfamily N-acetyltransferase
VSSNLVTTRAFKQAGATAAPLMRCHVAVTIRSFRVADQAAARALIEEGLGEHFGFIDFDANPDLVDIAVSYATPPNAFFVAEFDGIVVGTTGLVVDGAVGRVVRVAVAHRHRRFGVATALMRHVDAFARRLGLSELVAYTQPEWPDAMAFYRSHGFAPYGRDEIDVHLRRRLEAQAGRD